MTAQEWQPGDEALLRVTVKHVSRVQADVGVVEIPGHFAEVVVRPTSDLLPVAQSDAEVIERAALVMADHVMTAKGLCACGWRLPSREVLVRNRRHPRDEVAEHLARALAAADLLASPVQPGRGTEGIE